MKRYREALELPAPQEDDGLRPFSSRGVCADPLPCRLCPGLAFRSEAILVTHINEEHGGVEKYRQLFLCEEACQGHEVMGEEWRMILANFAAFQTQSATSWDDLNDMVKGTPHVRCRGGCCICARTAWSEDHRWAPLLGPQCPFQNCHKVAMLLSTATYAEKWPLIPKSELEGSSVLFHETLILVNTRRIPREALDPDLCAPVPFCLECYSALARKTPVMPMYALADSKWIGRIQRPFLTMHAGAFEAMKRERGFAHRLLLALVRTVTTKVILRPEGATQTRAWGSAFLQKGMKGTCVLLPNADRETNDTFPPPSLGTSFVAVFCGMNTEDLRSAQFGMVDREEFIEQASFLQTHNAVYAAKKFNLKEVQRWPRGESVPPVISENFVLVKDIDGEDIGDMRARGPAEEVEPSSPDANDDSADSVPWTPVLPDVSLHDLPVGSAFAVAADKFGQAEKIAVRTQAAEIQGQIESGCGPESEVNREQLLKACRDAQKALAKPKNLREEAARLQMVVERFESGTSEEPSTGVFPAPSAPQTGTSHTTASTENCLQNVATQDRPGWRVLVPTAAKPLSFFANGLWTSFAPMEFQRWHLGSSCYGSETVDG